MNATLAAIATVALDRGESEPLTDKDVKPALRHEGATKEPYGEHDVRPHA
jgi:hypothetical protein